MRTTLFLLAATAQLAVGAVPVIQISPEKTSPTLEEARDRIRELRKTGTHSGEATIEIAPGTYRLQQPLELDSHDANLTIRAAGDGDVILLGSIPVLAGENTLTPGKPLYGIHTETSALNVARHPDSGYATVSGEIIPYWQDLPQENFRTVTYDESLKLPRFEKGNLQILPRYHWWNITLPVEDVEPDSRTITLSQDSTFAIRAGDQFFLEDSRAFLDSPGEYYYDRMNGELEIIPPTPEAKLHATVLERLVSIKRSESITLDGITFRHAGTAAVVITDSKNCVITGCRFAQIHGDSDTAALDISGGSGCKVSKTELTDLGATGIRLTGNGHSVHGSTISHMGKRFKQGAGIRADGADHTLAGNHIHHGPRWGIGFHGTGHTIESNLIQSVSLETSDTGAIYTNGERRFSPLGVTIRNNTITDVPGSTRIPGTDKYGPGLAVGIYLDEGASGCEVTGNTIARTSAGSVFVHGGHANTISENSFSDCGDRGAGFDLWPSTPKTAPNIFEDNTFLSEQTPLLKIQDAVPEQLILRDNNWNTPDPKFLLDGMEIPAAKNWGVKPEE